MSYLEKNLTGDEQVIYQSSIHWFIFVRPLVVVLLGILFFKSASSWVHYIGLALLILGGFSFIKRFIQKVGTIYAVTNKKVLLKSGIIGRDALELMLSKCEGIRISQGIWGRVFGFGSIIVTTGGATNIYRYASSPLNFKNSINI